jgi:siroheme synthase
MPGPDYAEVARRLETAGLPQDLPCAVVSHASGALQKTLWTSVGALANEEILPAPALMIVGRVAAQQVREIEQNLWCAQPSGRQQRSLSVI